MFSFIFRAAFWLALVYYLVPFDLLLGRDGGGATGPAAIHESARASDIRTVTTSTILVRPDGRTIRVAAAPETGDQVAAARPARTAPDPAPESGASVTEVIGFCGRNPQVCTIGFGLLNGAASRAGDALEALGALVKPDPAPARHSAAASGHDTLTDSDRVSAPVRSGIP